MIKKRARKTEDKKERVETILKVARDLFIKKGFKGTTIREIARRAKLESSGTLYIYFKNKDELYGAICEKALKYNVDMLVEASKSSGSVFERLLLISKAYVRVQMRSESELLSMNLNDLKLSESIFKRFDELDKDWINSMSSILNEGKKNGYFDNELDVLTVSISIYGAMEGFVYYKKFGYLDDLNVSIDDLVEKHISYFLNGINK
ncbi:MAG: TetR/AcrR family transcriptional regulator [Desulfobacterales bacterium]|nr:TetR/AcrR family transcriptional regulator [Desulfobacterales bacterium]